MILGQGVVQVDFVLPCRIQVAGARKVARSNNGQGPPAVGRPASGMQPAGKKKAGAGAEVGVA
jgi:hypothetical protein